MILKDSFSVEVSEPYEFSSTALPAIGQNTWVKNKWPLVYFIRNDAKKIAYVGESSHGYKRIQDHLANPDRHLLNTISIVGSDRFNKSATLDIETKLIQYLFAEGTYQLQNSNFGQVAHNYYQQELYGQLFQEIWAQLLNKKLVRRPLEEIKNSELFKYSPYKSLSEDQHRSALDIIESLIYSKTSTVFVKGSAGTGKTVLASYLIKLLTTDPYNLNTDDCSDEELREINLVRAFRKRYPKPRIALVIAMSSLRKTLQNVFKKTPGLNPSMVISPSDTFGQQYDLLLVDEAHRLRQYKNIGWRGVFIKNNRKLGLGEEGNELNWILANSKNQVLFYDPSQSVKPSDINPSHFSTLLNLKGTNTHELHSQMRVLGGSNYISFVDELLNLKRAKKTRFSIENYELFIFDSFGDLCSEISKREKKHKLCRLIAGYSWPWKSKENKKAYDIDIEGLRFRWNSTDKDWVHSPNSFDEIGCIHTTQGYDLNYAGVIFGNEIKFNPNTQSIEIDREKYFDIYGQRGANDVELKNYIINIYKTMMYRGIKGTFIYACDPAMRKYLKEHIKTFTTGLPAKIKKLESFENTVPLYDLRAAAGDFSAVQQQPDVERIALPPGVKFKANYFAIRVTGESMNKIIPANSICLFEAYEGGSREGKIVLAEHHEKQGFDLGGRYTVKYYSSTKRVDEKGWSHTSITLEPRSTLPGYDKIALQHEETEGLVIRGIFVSVL